MAETDSDLISRARRGDREALATLLKRIGPEVRPTIAGRIPRRWQSVLSDQDIMQQTYSDAALGIGAFTDRGEGSFRAWMISLARCNLLDAIKALEAEKRGGRVRRVQAGADSWLSLHERLGVRTTTPSRHAAGAEAKAALQTAMRRLPEHYRRVIEMFDLEGLDADAVAEALGRSRGSVYMLRARALERLAEIMGSASAYLTR